MLSGRMPFSRLAFSKRTVLYSIYAKNIYIVLLYLDWNGIIY